MDRLRINTDRTPEWTLTLVVRGVDVPTIGPLEAADRSVVNLGARRPGVVVRLWRWCFGEPPRVVSDSHETEQLRHTVRAFVPAAHRPLLEQLSGGELMVLLQSYVGAQAAWAHEIEQRAREEAERLWASIRGASADREHAGSAEPTVTPLRPGARRFEVPATKLRPGQMPEWARGMFD